MKRAEVIPAILAKSRKEALLRLKRAQTFARRAQIDIIDGMFAKNKTILPSALAGTKTPLTLEFHLMVKHPEAYLHDVARVAQAKLLIFHAESIHSKAHALGLIEHARFHRLKVGIALNPATPAAKVKPYLKLIDQVLVMTVHPGFMGQKYLDQSRKIRQLRSWSKTIDIEVDGGIHAGTARACRTAGANLFVAGRALFKAKNIKQAYRELKRDVR